MQPIVQTVRFAGAATLAVALVTAACGSETSILHPTPDPGPENPVPAATFTLSGVIFEATDSGDVPLEGVSVENSETHEVTVTDANGSYQVAGIPAGMARISLSKTGYEPQLKEVWLGGDAQLDAWMVRQTESAWEVFKK